MDGNGIPIAAQWVAWAGAMLVGIQGIKKLPWLGPLLDRWLGPWWGIGLAVLAALAEGFVLYSGDGRLTGGEALQIVLTIGAAIGGHAALKVGERKTIG